MGIEIERKFLVHKEKLPVLPEEGSFRIEQGYLSTSPTVRVRLKSFGKTGLDFLPGLGLLTIKGPGFLKRAEYEYDIPTQDARDLLLLCSNIITKTRHEVTIQSHTWEVDVFSGNQAGLILAEVELKSADEAVVLPDWIRAEVTDFPEFTNSYLALYGIPLSRRAFAFDEKIEPLEP